MKIRLALLKSGEEVISAVDEMVVEDKVVGYIFNYPCTARLTTRVDDEGKSVPCKIKLNPWIPLTKDSSIPVVMDWVITFTNPIDKLEEMYIKLLEDNGFTKPESDSSDESEDPGLTD